MKKEGRGEKLRYRPQLRIDELALEVGARLDVRRVPREEEGEKKKERKNLPPSRTPLSLSSASPFLRGEERKEKRGRGRLRRLSSSTVPFSETYSFAAAIARIRGEEKKRKKERTVKVSAVRKEDILARPRPQRKGEKRGKKNRPRVSRCSGRASSPRRAVAREAARREEGVRPARRRRRKEKEKKKGAAQARRLLSRGRSRRRAAEERGRKGGKSPRARRDRLPGRSRREGERGKGSDGSLRCFSVRSRSKATPSGGGEKERKEEKEKKEGGKSAGLDSARLSPPVSLAARASCRTVSEPGRTEKEEKEKKKKEGRGGSYARIHVDMSLTIRPPRDTFNRRDDPP